MVSITIMVNFITFMVSITFMVFITFMGSKARSRTLLRAFCL